MRLYQGDSGLYQGDSGLYQSDSAEGYPLFKEEVVEYFPCCFLGGHRLQQREVFLLLLFCFVLFVCFCFCFVCLFVFVVFVASGYLVVKTSLGIYGLTNSTKKIE